jgi:hypothetical protein
MVLKEPLNKLYTRYLPGMKIYYVGLDSILFKKDVLLIYVVRHWRLHCKIGIAFFVHESNPEIASTRLRPSSPGSVTAVIQVLYCPHCRLWAMQVHPYIPCVFPRGKQDFKPT